VHAYCGRTCANNAQSNPGGAYDKQSQGNKPGSGNNNRPRGLADIIATELAQKTKQASTVSYRLVSSYKNNPIWRIEDTRGRSEISVARDYQNERIRVVFSLNDAESMGPDLPDEEEEEEDTSQVDDDEHSLDDEGEAMQCTILVSKPHKGTLLIKAVALGGHFLIDNVSHSDDTDLATKNSAEADYQRQNIYIAPQFDDLSENLQNGFSSFLDERGINDELAEFVSEYVKHKENDEHTNWLQGLQSFFTP